MRAMSRTRIRINAYLHAHLYIFIYFRQCTELVYILPVRCMYVHTHARARIVVVYLKRLTMVIAMVGGGDDTGGVAAVREID